MEAFKKLVKYALVEIESDDRFLLVFVQPLTSLFAILAFAVHPEVGVWENDFSLGDGENFRYGHFEKRKLRQLQMIFQEIIRITSGKKIHGTGAVPGGVNKNVSIEERDFSAMDA